MGIRQFLVTALTLTLFACGGGSGGSPSSDDSGPANDSGATNTNETILTSNTSVSSTDLFYFDESNRMYSLSSSAPTDTTRITDDSVDFIRDITAFSLDNVNMIASDYRVTGKIFLMGGRVYALDNGTNGAYRQVSSASGVGICRAYRPSSTSFNGRTYLKYVTPSPDDCRVRSGNGRVVHSSMTPETAPLMHVGSIAGSISDSIDGYPTGWFLNTIAGLIRTDAEFRTVAALIEDTSGTQYQVFDPELTLSSSMLIAGDGSIRHLDLATNTVSAPVFSTANSLDGFKVIGNDLYFIEDGQNLYQIRIAADATPQYLGTDPDIDILDSEPILWNIDGKIVYSYANEDSKGLRYVDADTGTIREIARLPASETGSRFLSFLGNGNTIFLSQRTADEIVRFTALDISGNILASYSNTRLVGLLFADVVELNNGNITFDRIILLRDANDATQIPEQLQLFDTADLATAVRTWDLPAGGRFGGFDSAFSGTKKLMSIRGVDGVEQSDIFFIDLKKEDAIVRVTNTPEDERLEPY